MSKSYEISLQRSSSEQVFEILRQEITQLHLEPGYRLSENELAKKFQLSRSPIREAFIKLSAVGLVEIRPQRGTFVSLIDANQVLEAVFVREALETMVLGKIINVISEATINECHSIIQEQQAAAASADCKAFTEKDDHFHKILYDATGIQRVNTVIRGEKSIMDRVRYLSLQDPQRFQVLIDHHQAILEFLILGNLPKVIQTIKDHLRLAFCTLEQGIQDHPNYFKPDPDIDRIRSLFYRS